MTALIIWIVIAVVCAALTGWLFARHGRPAWVGVILGLLFPIPAVIVSAIVFSLSGRRRTGAPAL